LQRRDHILSFAAICHIILLLSVSVFKWMKPLTGLLLQLSLAVDLTLYLLLPASLLWLGYVLIHTLRKKL